MLKYSNSRRPQLELEPAAAFFCGPNMKRGRRSACRLLWVPVATAQMSSPPTPTIASESAGATARRPPADRDAAADSDAGPPAAGPGPPQSDAARLNAERFREADQRMRGYWAGDKAMLGAWAGRVYLPTLPRRRPAWNTVQADYRVPYKPYTPYTPYTGRAYRPRDFQ